MKTLLHRHLAVVSVFAVSAIAAEPPALKDLFADPSYIAAQISPDGSYFAVVVPTGEKDVLAIIDRNKNKVTATMGFPGVRESVGDIRWIEGNRLIFEPHEVLGWNEMPVWYGELFTANADGSGFRAIYGYRAGDLQTGTRIKRAEGVRGAGYFLSELASDPDTILVRSKPWTTSGDAHPEVLAVNLRNGRSKKVAGAPAMNAEFLASASGEVRFAVATDQNNVTQVFMYDTKASSWTKMASNSDKKENMLPLALSTDGTKAFYLSNRGGGTTGLYSYTFETGSSEELYRHDEYSVTEVEFDPVSNTPMWAIHGHDRSVKSLDDANPWVQVRKRIGKSFPDSRISFTSYTHDYKKVVVFVDSDRDPGVWYSVDMETKKAKEELISHPAIDPEAMLPMQPIELTARDGLQLHGYYTAPKATGDKKPPMVLLVHGGPHSQDEWGFDPEVQALATRGYAVLQVNFRGSTGYGKEFEIAGRGEWGRAMQDDLTDATKWAIDQGKADPARICIMGASYGGYASLMGLIREPALYRCGIDLFGVTDLEEMLSEGNISEAHWGAAYLRSAFGADRKEWAARSPSRLADKIQAPVLIIAGEEDTQVPFVHSELMEEALKEAGKSVETLYFDKEAHGFFNPANRVKAYEKVLAFLDKHIGSQAATP